MLFNSLDFAYFLIIVFIFYWFLTNKNLENQNILIVLSSYVFFGWWDWRFLLLIIFSTTVDFLVGFYLNFTQEKRKRKILLWISIIVNLGLLGYFKYFNFFLESFVTAFTFFGLKINANSLDIILPVGISFYTFQTLSYTIDVYRKKLQPSIDFIAFSAFVSFFPQLVAGPIERASNLLPQFSNKRQFNYNKAIDGTRQILWGLFKKVVIADNCAIIVNEIFNNSLELNGSTLLIGAILFSFQIYGDFSGYSDIAIGTARLFGFNLMQNFAHPFFSRSIPEIWKRWHISLTTWFRDYLFIPLVKKFPINIYTKVINTFILFTIIGFWHGASWNFLIWGLYAALIFVPSLFLKHKKQTTIIAQGKVLPTLFESYQVMRTFLKFAIGMIFFRSDSLSQIWTFLKKIFSLSLLEIPVFSNKTFTLKVIILIIVFMFIEWMGREQRYAIEKISLTWGKSYRKAFYYLIVFLIFWFAGQKQDFIYFQF